MNKPMMMCGHAANAEQILPDGKRIPSCAICIGINPGASIINESPPSLEGKKARCTYFGSVPEGRNHESNYGCKRGEPCNCERPSSPDLAFFEHKPSAEFDSFYCGCWGWD